MQFSEIGGKRNSKHNKMAIDTTIVKELIQAGVHFGHKVSRWNPQMAPYIFGKRNFIHIIDVKESIKGIVKAYHFLNNLAKRDGFILFVGTKRQARDTIEKEAKRCGMPYVSERWIGGTLTNYETVRNRLSRLKEIEEWEKNGTLERYTKKEVANIMREKRKLKTNLEGIRNMEQLPSALIIIDPKHEHIAVEEADKIGSATIALIDTDGFPDLVDIPIPCNDDSMKVIQIILSKLTDAIIEGQTKAIGTANVDSFSTESLSIGGLREN